MITTECYFLDVGQGTSQVVLLPDGGAIVIDCGPNKSAHVLLGLLHTYLRGSIEVLAISHNDRDHDGGAVRILADFAERIRKIAYVQDRLTPEIRLFPLVQKLRREGRFSGAELRLEQNAGFPPLYEARDHQLRLSVFWPDLRGACDAAEPNAMSGILALDCGERRILFSGDASLKAWQGLHQRLGSAITCDVLSMPHHGASLGDDDWLYSEAVRAKYGIISVGSSNRYGHPSAAAIQSALRADVRVTCTEITPQCCKNPSRLGKGVTVPIAPSVSLDEGGRCLACAGTILVEISPQTVVVRPYEQQRRALKSLSSRGLVKPLCCP